jgi:hypothetical protein
MTKPRLIVVALVLSTIQLDAQGPTLCEPVTPGGERVASVVGGIGSGWPDAPFKTVAGGTDLVIEGTVVKHHSYLTPDGREIFTDYEFSVTEVIFQRQPQSSDRPGMPRAFVFKTRGGTIMCSGIPITWTEEGNGRRVTLKDGDHVIIFGKDDPADGKWRFSPWEVFYMSGELVKNDLPVLEGHDEGLAPLMPISAFAAKVREAANQR